jgi:hypothetical protein
MNDNSLEQTSYPNKVSSYAKSYWVSIGLFLSVYGALYLSSVILNRHTTADWEKAIVIYSPTSISPVLPRSLLDPLFFATSFPALIIGLSILCSYSIRGTEPKTDANKQSVAIFLTVLGFTYQVIGAWPLQYQTDFPWQWQKQIVSFGPIFAWVLYISSLTTLVIGAFSLYKHSVVYHQKHSSEENQNGKTVA